MGMPVQTSAADPPSRQSSTRMLVSRVARPSVALRTREPRRCERTNGGDDEFGVAIVGRAQAYHSGEFRIGKRSYRDSARSQPVCNGARAGATVGEEKIGSPAPNLVGEWT